MSWQANSSFVTAIPPQKAARNLSSILVFLLLGAAPFSLGQGIIPFNSYAGGPDVIDEGNLNVYFRIPIFSRDGRGLPFSFNLIYNSNAVWGLVRGRWWFNYNGWRSTEPLIGTITNTAHQGSCNGQTVYWYNGWYYTDPSGATHGSGGPIVYSANSCGWATSGSLVFQDGSGLTLTAYGTGSGTVTMPDGTLVSGNTVTDTNGNRITGQTGTLGTTVLQVNTGSFPFTYTYTAPNGTSVAVTENLSQHKVQSNFGCSSVPEWSGNPYLPDNIVLPDGSKYSITYEQTPGYPTGYTTGRIASITLPTGGTLSYTYSGVVCSGQFAGQPLGLTRQTPDGKWVYSRTNISGSEWQTVVTDPNSNQTVLYFWGTVPAFLQTEKLSYSGPSGGTLLETVITCYNNNPSPCNSTSITTGGGLPVTQRVTMIQIPDSSGKQAQTVTKYDGTYTLPIETDEYDFGNGAVGPLLRQTLVSYGSYSNGSCTALSNGIQDHPCQVIVKDGAGNLVAQSSYTYDQGAPTALSGTPQHVSVSGSRGNLTTLATLVSGTATLNKTFTYYDTGNVQTATDVNGAQTTYNYPDASSTCGNSFPGSITLPASMSTSTIWNCTGAVLTSATDVNKNIANLSYTDAYFWRPASFTDPAQNTVSFTYSSPNGTGQPPTEVESSLPITNGSILDILNTVDGLGRPMLSQRMQGPSPSPYDSVEFYYDNLGRAAQVSVPYSGNAGATYTGSLFAGTLSYGTLNRLTQVNDGNTNGGYTSYGYSKNDVLLTLGPPSPVEGTKQKQYEYDAPGHLTSVCEITSASGGGTCSQSVSKTGYWTSYSYDPMDRLTGVTQSAHGGIVQTRSITYDGLGRLTKEQGPESRLVTNVYDTESSCGSNGSYTSNGDLLQTTDANGITLCYYHNDPFHRLTDVSNNVQSSTNYCKRFRYDNTTGILGSIPAGIMVQNTMGRLAEAETDNCASPVTQSSIITDEWFSYDKDGRLTDVYVLTPHSGGYYHTTVGYYPNSAVSSLSGLPGYSAYTYTLDGEGRPTTAAQGTTTLINGVTFNAASQPTVVKIGSSGDSDSYAYDPATGRMKNYTFTVNSVSESGTLFWNPNGTLQSLQIQDGFNSGGTQTCNYLYDDLGRIGTPPGSSTPSVNCVNASNANLWGQNFTYDSFGNITKTVPSNATGIAWTPGYNSATNQYSSSSGATYDPSGNLLYLNPA